MKSIQLLDQMIERAKLDDETQRLEATKRNKSLQGVGESWMVFHLKALRELLLGDILKRKRACRPEREDV
ncbi:hypothetical protein CL634_01790 [bacterium]|nr:hypothetical protein [bacterium]|tara:strand:+ start:91 stop:300 length:210 start_codon:yes stop_codon:yes gene_type:complete